MPRPFSEEEEQLIYNLENGEGTPIEVQVLHNNKATAKLLQCVRRLSDRQEWQDKLLYTLFASEIAILGLVAIRG